jgi:hypothetical protein
VKLRDCIVELIDRAEAIPFIRKHEHLGTSGNASRWFGLRDPLGRLLGVVGFGHGPHAAGAIVLERGACLPWAPRNAASHLIGRALRHGRRFLGWGTVKAYSDPRFGEAGLVYRAAGFRQCPPSRHGDRSRYALVVGGQVLSDRAIYRRFGSHAAVRAAGRCAGTASGPDRLAMVPSSAAREHLPATRRRGPGGKAGLGPAPEVEHVFQPAGRGRQNRGARP